MDYEHNNVSQPTCEGKWWWTNSLGTLTIIVEVRWSDYCWEYFNAGKWLVVERGGSWTGPIPEPEAAQEDEDDFAREQGQVRTGKTTDGVEILHRLYGAPTAWDKLRIAAEDVADASSPDELTTTVEQLKRRLKELDEQEQDDPQPTPAPSDEELAKAAYEAVDPPARWEDTGPLVRNIWLTGVLIIRAKLQGPSTPLRTQTEDKR